MEQNLTEGSVGKTVIRFSVPFLLSYFLQTLYGMGDLYVIGRYCSVDSTTAVSIGSQVMHMLTVMLIGLSMGTLVTIGQAVGARDRRRTEKIVGCTWTLCLILSGALTLLLSLMAGSIVKIMSTPEKAAAGTIAYLRICFLGIPFVAAYNTISALFRGMGDSKTPMYFVAVACITNILLDFLFIGGLGMGPAGAALGTTLSQMLSVCIGRSVIVRRKKKGFSVSLKPSWNRELAGSILKIGLPVALQDGFIQIAFITITIFANHRGLQDAAAVGIVEKIIGMLFLVPSAMLQTVSTLASQNIGAGKDHRARQVLGYACFVTILWGLGVGILMECRAEPIIGLFSKDAKTVALGCQYMKGYVWDCLFAGIHFSFSGFFCAYGISLLSFLHNALSIVCVRIPLSYVAARNFPETLFPMGLASPAGSLLSVGICLTSYGLLRAKQKRKNP